MLFALCGQVTMHGYDNFTSRCLTGAELTDSDYLKKAAASFHTPPPLSQTSDYLQRQVLGSEEDQRLKHNQLFVPFTS